MGFSYRCSDQDDSGDTWTVYIHPLNICKNQFGVTARRSTFHLLIGKYSYGKYLCIPNWKIGTEMSHHCLIVSGTEND